MELSDILNSLSDDASSGSFDKTASDASSNALGNAIDRALHSGLTKQASAGGSPSADLVKMASRIASAESDSIVKEANLYGAAVADGFMARMGNFEKTASEDNVKLAFNQGYSDTMNFLSSQQQIQHQQVKTASYQEAGMVKQAAFEEGYNDVIKEAAFEEGYNDVIKEANYLTKTAAEFENYGFNYGNAILSRV